MAAVTAAVVGSAALGAYAANKQSKAAKSAANTQAQASDRAAQIQWDMFQQQRQDAQPWLQRGGQALDAYSQFMGLTPVSGTDEYARAAYLNSNPDVKAAGIDPFTHYNIAGKAEGRTWGGGDALQLRFKQTPGYQFAFNEGQRALESSAAAQGGLFSGKAGKALTKYGQDYADTEYGTHLNRLAGLAGVGQTATNQIGQFGQSAATNAGNALQNAASARASGVQGSAQAWGNYAGGLAGLAGMYAGNRVGSGSGWGWGGV